MASKKKRSREEILACKRELERERYNKIKNDPELRAVQQAKERKKYEDKKRKKKVKLVHVLTPRELRIVRKEKRIRTRNCRHRKKMAELGTQYMTMNSPASSIHGIDELQHPNQPVPPNGHGVFIRDPILRPGTSKQAISGQKRGWRTNQALRRKVQKLEMAKAGAFRKLARMKKKVQRLQAQSLSKSPKSRVERFLQKADSKEVKRKLVFHETLASGIHASLKDMSQKSSREFRRSIVKHTSTQLRKYRNLTCLQSIHARMTSKKNSQMHNKFRRIQALLRCEAKQFYEDDEVSRCLPGKKDTITRHKLKKQKRILNDTLKNLYDKFCTTHPNYRLSYPVFCRLRPFWVVQQSVDERDTCACTKHANMHYLNEALWRAKAIATADLTSTMKTLCCDYTKPSCLLRNCEECEDQAIPYKSFDGSVMINYFQWSNEKEEYVNKNGKKKVVAHCLKKTYSSTLYDAVKKFEECTLEFLQHEGRRRHQYLAINELKLNLPSDEVIIHCDFSENYACKFAEEIQSFHFGGSRPQCTLHTTIVSYRKDCYDKLNTHCMCTLSDSLDHTAPAIWAHLMPVFKAVQSLVPKVTKVHFLTDSPTSQYRNKIIFYLITKALKEHFPLLKIATWNYHEAGHGKGSVDGVGGCLKSMADRVVASGKDVGNFQDLVRILKENIRNVQIELVDAEEINQMRSCIPEALPTFKGTMKVHQTIFDTKTPQELTMKSLSCVSCYGCKKFKVGSMRFEEEHIEDPVIYNPTQFLSIEDSTLLDQHEGEATNHFVPNQERLEGDENYNYPSPCLVNTALDVGDFVLLKYTPKRKTIYYIGEVITKFGDNDFDVKYLRKRGNYFTYPNVDDTSSATLTDVIAKLPKPYSIGRERYIFHVKLEGFDIK